MAKAQPIPDVPAGTSLGAFAAHVVDVRVGEVRGLLASADSGADAVHDRRVAIRRLRTALEVFAPALPKQTKRVRRDLKAQFSALGARRDADVALEALRGLASDLEPEDQPGLTGLLDAFDAAGGPGPELALDTAAVLDACDRAVALVARAREDDGDPARDALVRAAGRRIAAVDARLEALEDGDAEALHELRIAAKRLRYVLEAAAPVLGPAAGDGAAAARELQTVLGELHDCDVMLPRMRAHRRRLRDADVAAVLAGARPAHGAEYRGVQAVDTRLRARRAALRADAAQARGDVSARLQAAAAELGVGR